MNLYDAYHYWDFCVSGGTNNNQFALYANTGPYGKTWLADIGFGLNGGDNIQYASFDFFAFDPQQGNNLKGEFGAAQYNWIQQGESFYGTITSSFVYGISMTLQINNPDSVNQCFNVLVTLWYY